MGLNTGRLYISGLALAALISLCLFFALTGSARAQETSPPSQPSKLTGATPSTTPTPVCPPAWVEKAPLPRGVMGASAAVYDDRLYLFGGRDFKYKNLATASRYEADTDSWTPLAEMPAPRNWAGAAAADGYAYVVNGSEGGGGLNSVFRYDISADTWQSITPTIARTYGPAVVALDGLIYRIGGLDTKGVFTSSVEVLGQGFVAPMPEGRGWAAAVAMDGYIYVAGGSTTGVFSTRTFRYDPATDTWSDSAIADLPEPKAYSASGVLDGRFVVAGGGDDYSTAFSWDPQTNEWSALPPLLYPRFNMPGGVVNDAMHVLGGINDTVPTGVHQQYGPTDCITPTPSLTPSPSTTATPTSPPTCTVTFVDVPPDHTFYTYVRCLACRGIVSGYPDGTFRPQDNVTRGQISKIVALAAQLTGAPQAQTFEDVLPGSTFYTYVEQLVALEIIGGYPCGSPGEPCIEPGNRPYFRPNSNATRGQLSKIVCHAYLCSGTVTGQTFEDVLPGSTFYENIEHLHALGAIGGYPCGNPEPCVEPANRPYFRPGNNVTRGQTAKIVSGVFYPECSR